MTKLFSASSAKRASDYLKRIASPGISAFRYRHRDVLVKFVVVVSIGAVLGALDGFGIFFEPKEPYKCQIFFAAMLKGALVALLTGFSLAATTRWYGAVATGALYGLAFGLVVYLAKGGPRSGDAPYVIPGGIISGGLIGLLILLFAGRKI